MKKSPVDPSSPIPLYHQIAESIRAQIEAGDLAAGAALEPLREAARTWGVNLHTVRHAYTALAREGLVESRGAGGTRVTDAATAENVSSTQSTRTFVNRILKEAYDVHGLDRTQLVSEIARYGDETAEARPEIYIIECSAGQCLAHAREIEGRYDVEAREWSLERKQEPPEGTILATYFHYNDIRRLWPHRLREVTFVTIVPDPGILDRIPDGVKRILICDRDETTAGTVASDFSLLLEPRGYDVEPLVSSDPISLDGRLDDDSLVLVAPRVWSGLDENARTGTHLLAATYVIDTDDLAALARKQGWRHTAPENSQPKR